MRGAKAPAAAASRDQLPLGLLAAAGFLSMTSARIMDPLLAVVAADFRLSVPTVSVVLAAFTLPYGLNQVLLGPLGDRFGKLRVMLGALGVFVVITALCGSAGGLPALVLFRGLAGATCATFIPAAMAYIGDAVPYELRQLTISRYMIGNVLGITMAGPIGGLLADHLGWRGAFVVLAGAGAVVTAMLAIRLPSLPDPRRRGPLFNPAHYLTLVARPAARYLLLGTAVEGAVTMGAFPFLAPYLHARFALSFATVGLVLSCFGVGAFLYSLLTRPLLPRLGEPGLILAGGLLITACLGVAVLLPSWHGFVLLETGLGLGYYLLHGVLQARATELLPSARSTSMASFTFMLFLGQGMGALGFAAWIAAAGYRAALLGDAGLVVVVTGLLHQLVCRSPRTAAAGKPDLA